MGWIKSAAHRRYSWRVYVALAAYVVTLLVADHLIVQRGLAGPAAVAVAFLPGVCVAAYFWALALFVVEEKDEYLRALLVRQVLVAMGVTMTVATLWGMLESFDLVPHVDAYLAIVVFCFGQALGALFNKLTLGDGTMF